MKNILVFGFYKHQNLGDDLFIDAYRELFPDFQFTFVNQINLSDLQNIDAVFIGGGSLLGEPLKVECAEVFNLLRDKKIFYIGVGAETDIHDDHYRLMLSAQLIALRSDVGSDKVKNFHPNVIIIPDLVYSLTPTLCGSKIKKSVLVIPNIATVPTWNDPHWKHASWDYFKTEMAQLLDPLVKEEGYTVNFLPLCTDVKLNDIWAANEIISRMQYRNTKFLLGKKNSLASVTQLISQYEIVITQRYHGIILSELSQTPSLNIFHHDKLKNHPGNSLSYYGLSKDKLREQFYFVRNTKVANILPINRDMFISLQGTVESALRHH